MHMKLLDFANNAHENTVSSTCKVLFIFYHSAMGIKGLHKAMEKFIQNQSKSYTAAHNIIDFSNIVYKRILSATESLGK